MGPLNGMPESVSAADTASIAGMSESTSGFSDNNLGDDLHLVQEAVGNSGLIGRSMRREVSVSFSDGRPSRLKKPPGILPAA
jgi:hypothetical protein